MRRKLKKLPELWTEFITCGNVLKHRLAWKIAKEQDVILPIIRKAKADFWDAVTYYDELLTYFRERYVEGSRK